MGSIRLWHVVFGLAALGAAGCSMSRENTSPHVVLRAEPRAGVAPLDVTFEASVTGGDGTLTYAWDLGDGERVPSGGAVVSHTYDAGGTFTATVTVTDADGDTVEASIDVAVGTASEPAAAITATPTSGTAPLAVELECAASGGNPPLAIHWELGDGVTADGESVGHTYLGRGTYFVTCTVTDADGSVATDRETITVALNSAPLAIASATYEGSDVPLDVAFHGEATGGDGALTYAWSFGDGESSAEQNPMHTYTAAGVYRAVLTVTDEDGDSQSDILTIEATAAGTTNRPPVAVATIEAHACAVPGTWYPDPMTGGSVQGGTAVELEAGASTDPDGDALSYSWVFVRTPAGSHAAFLNSGVENPTFTPDREGEFEVRVFVDDGTDRVASDVLTITASGPTTLTAVSGGGQTTGAGTGYGAPLIVRVENGCGAPVPGVGPGARGYNASATGPATDEDGESSFLATAGTRAGPASVTIEIGSMTPGVAPLQATFDLTVVAGSAAMVAADPTPSTAFDNPAGMAITLRVADAYGNPVTTTDASFTVCVAAPAGFGPMRDDCVDLSTTAGVATTTLHAPAPGELQLTMRDVTPSRFGFGGFVEGAVLDFEATPGDEWTTNGSRSSLEGEWEHGTPATTGPSACNSGTSCWGTSFGSVYAPSAGGIDSSWLDGHVEAWMFDHGPTWIHLVEYEWLDVPNASPGSFACNPATDGGAASIQTTDPWSPGWYYDLYPLDGQIVTGCTMGAGRYGSSGDAWRIAEYDLGRGRPPFSGESFMLRWNLARGGAATTGEGWYIDDVRVRAFFTGATWVRFVADCSNGIDDDGDGVVDFPQELGCETAIDGDETDPPMLPACANGTDDDRDGRSDYPADLECSGRGDPSEAPVCSDMFDNDDDGYVDFRDPECNGYGTWPYEERGQTFSFMGCGDGVDNDGDGLTDGHDSDCFSYFSNEVSGPGPGMSCSDGRDDDGDGWTDFEDPDCAMMGPAERGYSMFPCNDGFDNDRDGTVDRGDPDCRDAMMSIE